MPIHTKTNEDGSVVLTLTPDFEFFKADTKATNEERMLQALEYIATAVGILAVAKVNTER